MNGRDDSIEEFVIATIARFAYCTKEEVGRETLLADLNVDSLGIATLATFVEAEYGVTFTPSHLFTLYSAVRVDEVVEAVSLAASGRADDCVVATVETGAQARAPGSPRR
jgi:acyl carrier protein